MHVLKTHMCQCRDENCYDLTFHFMADEGHLDFIAQFEILKFYLICFRVSVFLARPARLRNRSDRSIALKKKLLFKKF